MGACTCRPRCLCSVRLFAPCCRHSIDIAVPLSQLLVSWYYWLNRWLLTALTEINILQIFVHILLIYCLGNYFCLHFLLLHTILTLLTLLTLLTILILSKILTILTMLTTLLTLLNNTIVTYTTITNTTNTTDTLPTQLIIQMLLYILL